MKPRNEKIRRANLARWADPEYRARHLILLAEARKASVAKCRFLPEKGTPERRLYRKVSDIIGAKAARAIL